MSLMDLSLLFFFGTVFALAAATVVAVDSLLLSLYLPFNVHCG